MVFKIGDYAKPIRNNNNDYASKVLEVDLTGNIRISDAYPPKFHLAADFILSGPLATAVAKATNVSRTTTLPTDSNERKGYPLLRGFLRYFPAAIAGVANISKIGNDKHNPGEELHHARGKSMDHGDCVVRHLMDVQDLIAAMERGDSSVAPETVLLEVNQLVWRAMALSQELHEKLGAPKAPGAR